MRLVGVPLHEIVQANGSGYILGQRGSILPTCQFSLERRAQTLAKHWPQRHIVPTGLGCQSVDGLSSEEETPQLPRTRSDASFMNVQRRVKQRSSGDLQRVKRHRFSINGHFYNYKTSIFTPAYGSVTNVRVSSTMTSLQVLSLLLNKFRVENKADEFALYIVHESGERTKVKDDEYPLVSRVLHGPCEKIAKLFIMEKDLGEEVPYDVAQYIKFEMPVLNSFVTKLREEEEREISKLTEKYDGLKSMILQQLKDISESTDCV
ncbi:hypothetical protein QTP70_020146 [Hemibagrus guttatus]|uniref:Ras association domain-containing protein 4 n=1 Tax=Hemibagrus guttatus TaxID=175788 RepID=A0AAE0RIY1_9TELE|nr:hypothetical protein QTP70_020146 [Hemibagrus guttatus]